MLDVAGMNYMGPATNSTAGCSPRRVIVGSETFPNSIDRLWPLVRDNPHVVGDFAWTGWATSARPVSVR